MSKMNVLKLSMTSFFGLILLLVVLLINMPLRLFAGDFLSDVNMTDLEGASAVSGHIWVSVEQVPGLIEVNYHWCPGLSLTSWCIAATHPSFEIDGDVSLVGMKAIRMKNIQIDNLDIAALNLGGGLVSGYVNGSIYSLEMPLVDCPVKQLKELDSSLSMVNLQIFGANAGMHQLQMTSQGSESGADIDVSLSGDTFSGSISLSNGRYEANGEMLAPDTMVSMAQSFMRSLGNNRFGWEISGNIPC